MVWSARFRPFTIHRSPFTPFRACREGRASYFPRLMEVVPIDLFGVHVDVPFPAPIGFSSAGLDAFGAAICAPATGLGLRAEQIRMKRWDDLFGYELSAQFFGENGLLMRSAERIKLGIRNGRTQGDWNIIVQTLTRFYTIMDFDPSTITTLSAHAHAKFPSLDEREQWLSQFLHSPLIARPAALGYVQIMDWEKDIRVLIEQSNVVPDGIFLSWDTQFKNEQDWESFLASLTSVMENSVNLFDLGFEPLREKV